MTPTEQFVHDYEAAPQEKREAMLREFLLRPIEPRSSFQAGVSNPLLQNLLDMLLTHSSALEQMTEDDLEIKALRAIVNPPLEPKTGLATGVWFGDDKAESVWGYRGTVSVVIQFAKPSAEYTTEPMVVSKCPLCERRALMDKFPSRKVKRWIILPP